ncbi:hypothetical protein DMB18_04305 [Enterococcus faecium]|nr:hypothetical protein DMB18_04305 [Enterococcus faecium]
MLFCCSQKRNRNQSEIDLQLLLSLLQLFSQINFGLSFFLLVILPAEHRYQDLLFLYDMNFDRSRHLMMKLNRYVCVA